MHRPQRSRISVSSVFAASSLATMCWAESISARKPHFPSFRDANEHIKSITQFSHAFKALLLWTLLPCL
ncbi:hypothetical protein PFISCL1PPCAC_25944 [Pristionchus fissidentatus]|uniref:Secreted protein n=1 Tax=Pristionchus fissidentatus TaxID=1538716 RepID=A0AAV5WY30_9BILA|nr:hypothetical protein PFISCL1PPCAC_25944 [Pristionchus fissidentatus]